MVVVAKLYSSSDFMEYNFIAVKLDNNLKERLDESSVIFKTFPRIDIISYWVKAHLFDSSETIETELEYNKSSIKSIADDCLKFDSNRSATCRVDVYRHVGSKHTVSFCYWDDFTEYKTETAYYDELTEVSDVC